MKLTNLEKHTRRRGRIRSKISGTAQTPRLSVHRSNKYIYLQLIDDAKGVTLAGVHSKIIKTGGTKSEVGFEAGKILALKAAEKQIKQVVFDRGGRQYHGRIKAVADGAREGGLEF